MQIKYQLRTSYSKETARFLDVRCDVLTVLCIFVSPIIYVCFFRK